MKNKITPILLILSSFLLFSCSLTNIIPGFGSSEPTPTEAATMAEGSMATEATEAPAMAETEASSIGGDSLQPDIQSKCYNPFFPIVEGASWTYQFDTGEIYTNTVSNVTDEAFTFTQAFNDNDLVLTADWYCSDDGILQGNFAQVDLLNQFGTDGGPEMTFETVKWEGQTLPMADLMQVGYEWTAVYNLTGDINLEGLETTADATVTIHYKVGAIEKVTVPAGTFSQAYRVDNSGDIEMSMAMNGATVPFNAINFNSSSWYVEGVGLVKTTDEFSGFSSGMELIESNMTP